MKRKIKKLKGVPKRRVGVRHTNAEYRRRYKLRHPDRVKKADADYYARKQAALKVAAATKDSPPAATLEEVDVKKVSPEALAAAHARFAVQFRRDVQKRIREEHDERMRKPPSVLKAEADALVKTLHECGRSVNFIADSLRVTVNHVREVLGIVVEPKKKAAAAAVEIARPVQLGLFPLEVLRHG